jgi:hypothetical protein
MGRGNGRGVEAQGLRVMHALRHDRPRVPGQLSSIVRMAAMTFAELVILAFTACNSFRTLAYPPQIVRIAGDQGGARAVSCWTWGCSRSPT